MAVTNYKTPGAYVEEIAKFPPSIAPVATAIPAFIGYTAKSDDDVRLKPTRITSMLEFEQVFGLAQDEEDAITVDLEGGPGGTPIANLDPEKRSPHILYYALQMYFANGGGPCWIVSVGKHQPLAAPPPSPDKNALGHGLDALRTVDEPTLIVIPESQFLDAAGYKGLHEDALQQCADLQDRFVIMDADADDPQDPTKKLSFFDPDVKVSKALTNARDNAPDDHLKYGAVYAPNLRTSLTFAYDAAKVNVKWHGSGAGKSLQDLQSTDTGRAAQALAALAALPLPLPPSSAIAGVFAKTDLERGVWKAPANAPITHVIEPSVALTRDNTDDMNVDPTAGKSVNAIRSITGRGTLVYGARTLAGNDNEWRYVNVRRFFIYAEESIKKATELFTFEPNDANTWVKVQAMIENFLTLQWRAGALQGMKPEHAFYVHVGLNKTMTAQDVLEGRMIVEIGMAVVRPAEFIVLRFSHLMPTS